MELVCYTIYNKNTYIFCFNKEIFPILNCENPVKPLSIYKQSENVKLSIQYNYYISKVTHTVKITSKKNKQI